MNTIQTKLGRTGRMAAALMGLTALLGACANNTPTSASEAGSVPVSAAPAAAAPAAPAGASTSPGGASDGRPQYFVNSGSSTVAESLGGGAAAEGAGASGAEAATPPPGRPNSEAGISWGSSSAVAGRMR